MELHRWQWGVPGGDMAQALGVDPITLPSKLGFFGPHLHMVHPPPWGEAIAPRASGLSLSEISSAPVLSLDDVGRVGQNGANSPCPMSTLRWVLGAETPASPTPQRLALGGHRDRPSVLNFRGALWYRGVWAAAWLPTDVTVW